MKIVGHILVTPVLISIHYKLSSVHQASGLILFLFDVQYLILYVRTVATTGGSKRLHANSRSLALHI